MTSPPSASLERQAAKSMNLEITAQEGLKLAFQWLDVSIIGPGSRNENGSIYQKYVE
jgi:hypothetical protein